MQDVSVEELAKILQQDDDWLAEHYEEAIEKYPGQIIAIDGGEIVAVGDEEVKLYCASRKKNGQLVGPFLVEVPSPNPNVHGFLLSPMPGYGCSRSHLTKKVRFPPV